MFYVNRSRSGEVTGAWTDPQYLYQDSLSEDDPALIRKRKLETYQRKRTRTELLDAVTRRRVIEAQGLDDSANSVPAEHDFSEEEIAQNAQKKWRYNVPSQ